MGRRLLIPGTGGCIYGSTAGDQIGSIFDLARSKHRHLLCAHADEPDELEPMRTSGLGSDDAPVQVEATGYIRAVYQWFHQARRPRYRVWAYDWRLDIRRSGSLLVKFFEDEAGAGDKWDVVCHSQGGLVLIAAAIQCGAEKFARWVRRVVFVGVPIFGTINAAAALMRGVSVLPGVTVSIPVVRTWPSIYMMLPRWWVGIASRPALDMLFNSTWSRAGLLAPAAATDLRAGLDRRLLARARAWESLLANFDFAPFLAIERFCLLQGKNHPTRVRSPAFPALPAMRINGDTVDRGDSLVPADRTYELLPRPLRDATDTFYTNVRSHMLFCSQRQTYQLCESLFS